jgi:pimeloyl-ACP methyl ester carboxylesterase
LGELVATGGLVFDTLLLPGSRPEPVLLLHGFPQSAQVWRRVWPALTAAGHPVIAPDQRGYSAGARPEGVDDYTMPLLVGDVLHLLDALGSERAHLVGHDWGAAVAWQVAARHPHRVRSLTALSVPHPVAFRTALRSDADQRERSRYMRMFVADGSEQVLLGTGPASLLAFFAGASSRVDPIGWVRYMSEPGRLTAALAWYRASRPEHFTDLPPLTVPTLYVWSDHDRALGRAAATATASWVDGPYRFVELAGISHWVPEEAPEQVGALLLEHVSRWSSTTPAATAPDVDGQAGPRRGAALPQPLARVPR